MTTAIPSLSEIMAVRKTRLASELIEMDSQQLANETVNMLKRKHRIDDDLSERLKAEIAEWTRDEILGSLWDGCQVTFVNEAPSFTEGWMERCTTIWIDDFLKAVESRKQPV